MTKTNQPPADPVRFIPTRQSDAARCLDIKLAEAQDTRETLTKQLRETERQIGGLLDRIVEASSPSVVAAYERGSRSLSTKKSCCPSERRKAVPPKGRLEDCTGTRLGIPVNL